MPIIAKMAGASNACEQASSDIEFSILEQTEADL
jgi:hypothetical protein